MNKGPSTCTKAAPSNGKPKPVEPNWRLLGPIIHWRGHRGTCLKLGDPTSLKLSVASFLSFASLCISSCRNINPNFLSLRCRRRRTGKPNLIVILFVMFATCHVCLFAGPSGLDLRYQMSFNPHRSGHGPLLDKKREGLLPLLLLE